VRFMVDLLATDELEMEDRDAWFAVLALYKNPTRRMIASLTVKNSRGL